LKISLQNIAKRFRSEWIFRDLSFDFESGTRYAVLGHNGSGKSTLLQIISGHLTPSRGDIRFFLGDKLVDGGNLYRYMAYSAPYSDIIEEFTLREAVEFHQKFKPFINQMTTADFRSVLELPASAWDKEIRFFSSGMKQRVRLALAVCADVPVLLLDEPTTNLDTQGVRWYRELIGRYTENRLVIVASNIQHDYDFCEVELDILVYK
jgi:ABC-type multidrug transport system ATPase subunit